MPFKTLYCNEGVFVKMKYAKKKVFSTVRVIIETNNIKKEIKLIYTLINFVGYLFDLTTMESNIIIQINH